jgi:hypothetical protein
MNSQEKKIQRLKPKNRKLTKTKMIFKRKKSTQIFISTQLPNFFFGSELPNLFIT